MYSLTFHLTPKQAFVRLFLVNITVSCPQCKPTYEKKPFRAEAIEHKRAGDAKHVLPAKTDGLIVFKKAAVM